MWEILNPLADALWGDDGIESQITKLDLKIGQVDTAQKDLQAAKDLEIRLEREATEAYEKE